MALIPYEIIGAFVNELRARRARGARAADLVRYLDGLGVDPTPARQYFRSAFEISFPGSFLYHQGENGGLDYESIGETAEPLIDAARDSWSSASPYPDLASRRDREAFRAFARRRRVYLLVSAVDPLRDPVAQPTYLLHGVYAHETGENVFTRGDGAAIRAELNLALGGERVRSGPQDLWEHRTDGRAGSLAGPRDPVFCFEPHGNVHDCLDVNSLADWYQYRGWPWPYGGLDEHR